MKSDDVLGKVPLAFIGAGAMGEAMIGGLLAKRLVAPGAITAADRHAERLEVVRRRFHIHTTRDNRAAVRKARIVVLSVKPQVLPVVLGELRGGIPASALVLSIVAGARIELMTVWTATPEVTESQRRQAQSILQALGRQLYVDDESFLDMATAISGTGPAYVFLLMEALIDAAVHLGFSRAEARELVVQTIRGSAHFAERSTVHPAEMRNMVTSPGGTSAAALYQLEKGAFRTVISKAVLAAYRRSVELGQLSAKLAVGQPEPGA